MPTAPATIQITMDKARVAFVCVDAEAAESAAVGTVKTIQNEIQNALCRNFD
jgi:hypothetical protein